MKKKETNDQDLTHWEADRVEYLADNGCGIDEIVRVIISRREVGLYKHVRAQVEEIVK
jgi:hypothetical protein